MRYDVNAERRNRDYKQAALQFREDQAELLARISLAQQSGDIENACKGLADLECRALELFRQRALFSPKLDFIQEYRVTISEDGVVSFVLPKGVSHTDFLRHAQNVACDLYGETAVFPPRLSQWEKFPTPLEYGGRLPDVSEERVVSVKLALSASAQMTLKEQDELLASVGGTRASVIDTAAGCAAYFVLTGKAAFDESIAIRAKGGCVYCSKEGVGMRGVSELDAAPWILVAVDMRGQYQ